MILGVILPLLALAAPSPDPLVLAAIAYQNPTIHELNWVGRQVAATMANSPFKLDEKTIFLYNYPNRAIVIRDRACEAWAVAGAICGGEALKPEEVLVVHHEEEDAIRHFSLAAHLTCAQGRQVTEVFLAANEGDPARWSKSSRMDIHNNYQGISWAGEKGSANCQLIGFTKRVAAAALKQLHAGELVTLKRGNSLCAQGHELIDYKSLARLREFRVALRQLDARCGGKAITSP